MLLTVSSAITIVYLAATTLYTLVSLIFADRKMKTKRIRNYKKGKFLIHYPAAFPIFFAVYIKTGKNILLSVINSFKATLSSALLSFDMELLWPFMEENPIFFTAALFYIFLTILNTALFSISVFFRKVANNFSCRRIRRGKSNVIVLVGYSEGNRLILNSMERGEKGGGNREEKNCDVLVIANRCTDRFKDEMYINRAAYVFVGKSENIADVLKNRCAKFDERHVSVIIQTGNNPDDVKYAFQIANLSAELKESVEREFNNSNFGIDAYVFDMGNNDEVFRRISKISGGAVHSLNKYNMIARDFINNYPLTSFLKNQIDTKTATFKQGTDARVMLIGLGNVNLGIFRAFMQNNQFLTTNDKGELEPLTVKYHIFDKRDVVGDAAFSQNYLRYENLLKNLSCEEKKDYFDLPTAPAELYFHQCDINSGSFCDEFKNYLTTSDKGCNIVIVALGEDVAAFNIAQKLATYTKEMKAEKITSFFVRIRDKVLGNEAHLCCDTESAIIPFGDSHALFSYQRITTHEAVKIAKDRHLCYAIESKRDNVSEDKAKHDALVRWHFEWKNIQRESNIYACLSIRSRVNLLGYDIKKSEEGVKDDSESFLKDYMRDNEIVYRDEIINGKRIVNYDVEYHKPRTPRTNLAICEHARWNAYHIANGYIPATKEEYKTEGKAALLERRKHINIASVTGLSEYADWLISEHGVSPSDADVIKYDYQLMDDAVWLLGRSGYSIVKK